MRSAVVIVSVEPGINVVREDHPRYAEWEAGAWHPIDVYAKVRVSLACGLYADMVAGPITTESVAGTAHILRLAEDIIEDIQPAIDELGAKIVTRRERWPIVYEESA